MLKNQKLLYMFCLGVVYGFSCSFFLAEPFQPKTQKDAAGYKKIGKKKKQTLYLPLLTKKKIKSDHSCILPNPSVLTARKHSATMKGGFHKQWPLLPAGQSNSSRHLTQSMSSNRETESSASVKSSGGLQGADRRRWRDLIRSQVVELLDREGPRPSETLRDKHWLYKVRYLQSDVSPCISGLGSPGKWRRAGAPRW